VYVQGLCVCTGSLCMYRVSVSVHGLCVCTGSLCLYRVSVSVQGLCVCTGYLCLYRVSVYVQGLCVCTGSLCIYRVSVYVQGMYLEGHCVCTGSLRLRLYRVSASAGYPSLRISLCLGLRGCTWCLCCVCTGRLSVCVLGVSLSVQGVDMSIQDWRLWLGELMKDTDKERTFWKGRVSHCLYRDAVLFMVTLLCLCVCSVFLYLNRLIGIILITQSSKINGRRCSYM
jgi:hypothetical protein